MSGEGLSGVRGYLRGLVGRHRAGGQTDDQLLDRFVARGDETAFAALLERHGPLVWGVCRRMLRHVQDAEDAFQATFLVLVRSGGSIRNHSSVRGWLHGVALKVAVRAKARRNRRQALERTDVEVAVTDPTPEVMARDLGPVLDEEIRRLPEKYRVVFILCCLEGKTGEQAAEELGCPRGTVATRLARARQRLQSRLARRGVTATEGALVVTAPTQVALSATQDLTAGLISPAVLTLTEEVLRTMLVSKLKTWTAAALFALVLGGGAVAYSLTAAPLPQEKKEAPPAGKGRNEAVARLAKKKVELASRGFKAIRDGFLAGRDTPDTLYDWSKRWLDADREANNTAAGQQAALEAHLERMKEFHGIMQAKYEAGRATFSDACLGEFARVEAELWLTRHKGKK